MGPSWRRWYTCRTRHRIGPSRHRILCWDPILHVGSDIGSGQTDVGSFVGIRVYMSDPTSGQVKQMSGPLWGAGAHVGSYDGSVQADVGPLLVDEARVGSNVGSGQTNVGSFVGSWRTRWVLCRVGPNRCRVPCWWLVRMSGPMSGRAQPTSGPLWAPGAHVRSFVG